MSRRHTATITKPDCPHYAAEWAEYRERLEARRARQTLPNTYGESWPSEPVAGHGYCEECRLALLASSEPWPADVWAWLDYAAATSYQGTGLKAILKTKPALPKYQGPRTEKLEKLYARACEAFKVPDDEPRCAQAIGQGFGLGFGVVTTNGHGAIVKAGGVEPGAKVTQILQDTPGYVDLPADFHAALKRVRLFASERQNAIKLEVGPWRVRLSASDGYANEASETVELAGPGTEVPEVAVCLNAEYLDAICGVWPLRWHLRAGSENDAQSFQPAGADWRAVIMPMRV